MGFFFTNHWTPHLVEPGQTPLRLFAHHLPTLVAKGLLKAMKNITSEKSVQYIRLVPPSYVCWLINHSKYIYIVSNIKQESHFDPSPFQT